MFAAAAEGQREVPAIRHVAASLVTALRHALLPAIVGLCLARMWIAPLPSSFWVDEMATEFVVQHGAADPSFRVAPQVPQSAYYVFPKISQSLFGQSEIAYRIPSVLFMGGALWLIALIARRLIHPKAGWFAVFACLLLKEFDYQAADARPYAFGTLAACASLYFLIRWLDTGRWRDAAIFGVCATVVWRIHMLFWPLYVLVALYTAMRLLRRETRARWGQATVVGILLSVSLIPVVREVLALLREAKAHVVVAVPKFEALVLSVKPTFVLPFAVAGLLLAWWTRRKTQPGLPDARTLRIPALTLIAGWWLCQPLCLYLYSLISGNSVFLSRYLYLALPGTALMATAGLSLYMPGRYWKPLAAVFGLAVLLFHGKWDHLVPAHHNSGWREAAAAIGEELASDTPVICPSPFIEARPPEWQPDYPVSSFLYSHLATYPVRGRVYPFPFETSPQAERFAQQLMAGPLTQKGEFLIYGGDRNVWFWRKWFAARPELAGWKSRRLGPFGDVEVVAFAKGH